MEMYLLEKTTAPQGCPSCCCVGLDQHGLPRWLVVWRWGVCWPFPFPPAASGHSLNRCASPRGSAPVVCGGLVRRGCSLACRFPIQLQLILDSCSLRIFFERASVRCFFLIHVFLAYLMFEVREEVDNAY